MVLVTMVLQLEVKARFPPLLPLTTLASVCEFLQGWSQSVARSTGSTRPIVGAWHDITTEEAQIWLLF